MKRVDLLLFFLLPNFFLAQNTEIKEFGAREIDDFTIAVVIPNNQKELDIKNSKLLENRLLSSLSNAGISGVYPDYSFVLFPLLRISDKEITTTSPTLFAITCDLNLYLMDYENLTSYGSFYIELTGVGKTEQIALRNALKKFNSRNKGLQDFLIESKTKVLTYISRNCHHIIAKAKSKAQAGTVALRERSHHPFGDYNKNPIDGKRQALSMLSSIDESHDECYDRALELMNEIYEEIKNESCQDKASEAKIRAAQGQFYLASLILLTIPAKSSCQNIIDETIEIIKNEKELNTKSKLAIDVHKHGQKLELNEQEIRKVLGRAYMEQVAKNDKSGMQFSLDSISINAKYGIKQK